MKPSILIGVCSCFKHSDRRAAVRQTWLRQLPENVSARFFVGQCPQENLEPDVIQVSAPDGYFDLAAKVQAIFSHALKEFAFDYLFKCDDDTYVHVQRLNNLLKNNDNFIGSSALAHRGFAGGGAGYLLSRKAVQIVAEAPPPDRPEEDIWVSRVVQSARIKMRTSDQLKMRHARYPRAENNIITAHRCEPDVMRLIHEGIEDPGATDVMMILYLQPSNRWKRIRLLRNGIFFAGGILGGRWKLSEEDETLVLDWQCEFRRTIDTFHRTTFGYRSPSLDLELSRPTDVRRRKMRPSARLQRSNSLSERLPS